MFRILAALDAWDRRLFDRLTGRQRRVIDRGLKRLSNSATRSVLWFAIAALIAILGGHRGRRAALRGVLSIAITSTLVNLPLKYLARRDRPPMRRGDRPLPGSLPGSFSFPSGHSGSGLVVVGGSPPRRTPAARPHPTAGRGRCLLAGPPARPLSTRRAGWGCDRNGDGAGERAGGPGDTAVVGCNGAGPGGRAREDQRDHPRVQPERWPGRIPRPSQGGNGRDRTSDRRRAERRGHRAAAQHAVAKWVGPAGRGGGGRRRDGRVSRECRDQHAGGDGDPSARDLQRLRAIPPYSQWRRTLGPL